MKNITFTRFLKNCETQRGPVGDFARDWLTDTSPLKPQPSKGLNSIIKYLNDQNACDGCLTAAKDAWGKWSSSKNKLAILGTCDKLIGL